MQYHTSPYVALTIVAEEGANEEHPVQEAVMV
jgi:hypothetical protein